MGAEPQSTARRSWLRLAHARAPRQGGPGKHRGPAVADYGSMASEDRNGFHAVTQRKIDVVRDLEQIPNLRQERQEGLVIPDMVMDAVVRGLQEIRILKEMDDLFILGIADQVFHGSGELHEMRAPGLVRAARVLGDQG